MDCSHSRPTLPQSNGLAILISSPLVFAIHCFRKLGLDQRRREHRRAHPLSQTPHLGQRGRPSPDLAGAPGAPSPRLGWPASSHGPHPRNRPHSRALYAPSRGHPKSAGGPARGHCHAHGLGQDLGVQRARAGHAARRPGGTRALHLPAQGPGAGSVRRAKRSDAGFGRRAERGHLRRRHYGPSPPANSHQAAARALHHAGHAALGHLGLPRGLGRLLRSPALRGHRRAARIQRRLWLPRPAPFSPLEPHLRALRVRAGVHHQLGDDGQPPRAGGRAAQPLLLCD